MPSKTSGPANSTYRSFAFFGAFWGVWGGSLPRIQDRAGVSDGELGLALLFIGAGALPAMLLTGRALDRWGMKVASLTVSGLGLAGAATAFAAVNLPALCAGLALVGATSGATDVAINALAGRAEQDAGRPVIARSHGVFSTLVVAGSLGTGLSAGLPVTVPFAGVALLALSVGAALPRTAPPRPADPGLRPASRTPISPLLLLGLLGAIAFATENAYQSWSAVYAHDELGLGLGPAAVAPAVFAATVALTRFAVAGLAPATPRTVLLAGASAATAGTLTVAFSPTLTGALAGLLISAAGTAVLFPTLIGVVSRDVEESHRGRATSVVTAVSYLGFLLSPPYVGLWASLTGLRGAMLATAALPALLLAFTPFLLTTPARGPRSRREPIRSVSFGEGPFKRSEGEPDDQ